MGKSVKIKSHREISDVIKCKGCGEKHMAMLWPKMPSTGKPRLKCCGSGSGANRRAILKQREFSLNGEIHYRCNKCEDVKPPSEFYFNKGRPNNYCKQCKKEGIKNSPSQLRRVRLVEENRKKRATETKTCKRCGETSLKSSWPRSPSGTMAVTCCRQKERRRRDELIASGKSICTSCKETKILSRFTLDKKGRPHSWCKDCQKAHMSNSGSREKRQRQIDETSDGTLTKDVVGSLFGRHKVCPCCGVDMKRNDKHLDHIVPLSKGGRHSICNVMILCSSCNLSKSTKDFIEWFVSIPKDNASRLISNLEGDSNLTHILQEAREWHQQVV